MVRIEWCITGGQRGNPITWPYLEESCCWPERGTSVRPSCCHWRWVPPDETLLRSVNTFTFGSDYWPTGQLISTKRVDNPILVRYYFCRDFRFKDRISIARIWFRDRILCLVSHMGHVLSRHMRCATALSLESASNQWKIASSPLLHSRAELTITIS